MGKLLSLLARDDSNCCTPKTYDVFLDFENAAPTDTEREIYDEVERVLRESEAVLDEIQCYKVSLRPIILNIFQTQTKVYLLFFVVVVILSKDILRRISSFVFWCKQKTLILHLHNPYERDVFFFAFFYSCKEFPGKKMYEFS